jgi:hypothetical protein
MLKESNRGVTLYVDRSTQRWVVRDPGGEFWSLPSCEDAWEARETFHPSDESRLELVPGHYKYLFRLPFV